jgi:hypothetical protein
MADNALAKQVGKKMPERRKTRLEQIADEIQAYGGRVRDDFMAGAERSAQGLGDIVERGDVLTGIPRLALGGTSWMGAPVSAALSPVLGPILQPVGEAVNTYVGQPVEDLTGYPADITNDLAMTGLTLGAVKGLGMTRPYLARAADQVEGMANRAGYTFQPDPSVRFTFGGPTALTADKAKLARAKQMAKDGASSDDIFSETGWFKGVDDKWRFEIPDQQSQMTRDIGTKASVGDVLSHPKLFEAYPDLATIKLYGLRNQDEGMYMPQKSSAGEAIFVGDNNAHSTLLHELQHALQAREGFSSGARLKDNPKAKDISRYKRSAGEVEARNVETRLSLSPEQLTTQAFAPWRTADTAPYHQIVDKRSKGGSASYGSGPTLTPLVNEVDGGLIAYHGTTEKGIPRLRTRNAVETLGAVFASSKDDVAETFTVPREYGEPVFADEFGNEIARGEVLKLKLQPKNTLVYPEAEGQKFIDDTALQARVVKEAKAAGHDMIHVKNVMEGIGERFPGDVYVILDDSIISILKRYGIPMTAAAGGGMMVMGQDMPPEVASQIGG